MPKRGTSARDLILGLLFFGGLFGLAFVTTQLTSLSLTGTRQHVTVLFEDVYGVQREDKVLVHGTRYGRVRRVEPVDAAAWREAGRDLVREGLVEDGTSFVPHVLVVLELEHDITLRPGFRVWAEDTNLLGGKSISIEPGDPAGAPITLPDDSGSMSADDGGDLRTVALVGFPRPHPITALGKLVENNLGDLDAIVDNILLASQKLNDPEAGLVGYALNDPDAVKKVDDILDRVASFSETLDDEQSLVHDLFSDSPLRADVTQAAANFRTFSDGINADDSVVSRLTRDDSPWIGEVDRILGDVSGFTARLEAPDSLVGRILAEGPGTLGEKLDHTVDQVNGWVDTATSNPDSLLYQIAYGDLGASVRRTVDGLDETVSGIQDYVVTPIRDNTSLAGMIFNDPDTRSRADRMVRALLGVIEDAREAAPVTSLGSFIFGGF